MRHLRSALLLALASAALAAQAQNLVVNGDFNTGDLTGFAHSGSTIGVVNDNQSFDGTPCLRLGTSYAEGTVSQTVATNTGARYSLSFDLKATRVSGPKSFRILFGSDTVLSVTNADSTAIHYSFDVTATSARTTILIAARNDNSYWRFDNLSLTAYPFASAVPGPMAALPFALMALRRRKRA